MQELSPCKNALTKNLIHKNFNPSLKKPFLLQILDMTCRSGKEFFIFLAVVTTIPQKSVQWDPDAGIVTSWTKYPRVTVNVSSSSGTSDPRSVVDDNDNTMWVSGNCLPSGFVSDPELNLFHGLCDNINLCSVPNSPDIYKATDGNPSYTVATINPLTRFLTGQVSDKSTSTRCVDVLHCLGDIQPRYYRDVFD